MMGQYGVRAVFKKLKLVVEDWMGAEGFGGIVTCRRDCMPRDIPVEYLYKKKIDESDRTKVAHFFNHMVVIKNPEAITEMTTHADGNDTDLSMCACFISVNIIV
eukprot:920986-Ditylum_brightwellii.AAC.1